MEAVRETAQAQAKIGHRIEVLTLDGPDVDWLGRLEVPVIPLGQGPSGRYGFNARLIPWLRSHSRAYDALILHGIWDYVCLGAWRALRGTSTPYFIYSHGMLDPWFSLAPIRYLKKRAYWRFFAHRIFRDARGVLFTSEQERQLAAICFRPYACREFVVPLGSSRSAPDEDQFASVFLDRFPRLRGKRIVLFFGRVHPKKNLDLLLRAFATVAPRHPDTHLVVAGPDDEGFGAPLRRLAEELKIESGITWTGLLDAPELRFGALHAADVFVLPSHSENFGFSIVEALARGVPVLISKRVNIWQEIIDDGAGFAEEDTFAGTTALLSRWLSLDTEAQLRMRFRAIGCFEKRFEVSRATAELMRRITTSIRSGESHPRVAGRNAGTPR